MMKQSISYTSYIPARFNAEVVAQSTKLVTQIAELPPVEDVDYTSPYAPLSTPFDTKMHTEIKELVNKFHALRPHAFVLIGIGGSNLGACAIHQALQYYDSSADIAFYYLDTIDTDETRKVLHCIRAHLERSEHIIVNIVSKSGTTFETIINGALVYAELERVYGQRAADYCIITTDRDSPLDHYGKVHNIHRLHIPHLVGGRYSVFSAVGLFPLAFLGYDIEQFCSGARDIYADCISVEMSINIAAYSASVLAVLYRHGYVIHDTFLFSVPLEGLGKWYRQLLAESIGKSRNRSGKTVHEGITPTISIGSTDLHSIAQLNLSGPYNKMTTFVTITQYSNYDIPPIMNHIVYYAPDVTTNRTALFGSVCRAYVHDDRPYISLTLPEKNAYYCGQFMYLKMYEIIYLGYILEVNPFDQPGVELYKKEMRMILTHGT